MATESTSFAEIPKSCQNTPFKKLTFELPLSTKKLTSQQQTKIREFIDGARIQDCILQMQYDGLLQQVIAILFDESNVTEERLKPFYDKLSSLSHNKTENKVRTIIAIRKTLSDQEWKDIIATYTCLITANNNYIEQQTALQQSYDILMKGDNSSEFATSSLASQSFYIEKNPKLQMLEKIISTLPLTNTQQWQFRDIIRLQERQIYSARHDISQFIGQLLPLLALQYEQLQNKHYQVILSQLFTKEYLQEFYKIQTLSSLFEILTPNQKMQLRKKYMIMKGIL